MLALVARSRATQVRPILLSLAFTVIQLSCILGADFVNNNAHDSRPLGFPGRQRGGAAIVRQSVEARLRAHRRLPLAETNAAASATADEKEGGSRT